MPRVSVIIPAYNRADLLPQAIASVLAQTYRDFEVIVVDDGSTDDTAAVAEQFGRAVRVIRQANAGEGAARNRGIVAATGELIAFLDSDDLWLPTKLARQVDFFKNDLSIGLVYTDAVAFHGKTGRVLWRFSERFQPHQGWVGRPLLQRCFIAVSTVMARTEVVDEVGRFNESHAIRNYQDWDLWLRIAARWPIGYIPLVLARWRVHSGNMSGAVDALGVLVRGERVMQRAVAFAPDLYLPALRAARYQHYTGIGRMLARQGRGREARRILAKAQRLAPLRLRPYIWYAASFLPASLVRAAGDSPVRERVRDLARLPNRALRRKRQTPAGELI